MIKKALRRLCPPALWSGLSQAKRKLLPAEPAPAAAADGGIHRFGENPEKQDLDVYWDPEFAKVLETWGEGNTWNEIQLLLVNCRGRVLDSACGTGIAIERLSRFPQLEVHGFDVSDFLIEKAALRGIPRERLKVAHAAKLPYADSSFDYSYSIGSLEHFTEELIDSFVPEDCRVTKTAAFHFMPVARSGKDEGWTKTAQSYFNNSVEWWLQKFARSFPKILVFDSRWHDAISIGKWFVCMKREV